MILRGMTWLLYAFLLAPQVTHQAHPPILMYEFRNDSGMILALVLSEDTQICDSGLSPIFAIGRFYDQPVQERKGLRFAFEERSTLRKFAAFRAFIARGWARARPQSIDSRKLRIRVMKERSGGTCE